MKKLDGLFNSSSSPPKSNKNRNDGNSVQSKRSTSASSSSSTSPSQSPKDILVSPSLFDVLRVGREEKQAQGSKKSKPSNSLTTKTTSGNNKSKPVIMPLPAELLLPQQSAKDRTRNLPADLDQHMANVVLRDLESQSRKSESLNGAYASLFATCYKSPNVPLTTLERVFYSFMRRGNPSKTHFTTMITAYSKAKNVTRALEVFSKMQEHGIRRDKYLYNVLIHLLGKVGRDRKAAFDMLTAMKGENIRPDHVTYGTLIEIQAAAHDADGAMAVFEEMIENGVRPNQYIFSSLIMALHRGKRAEEIQDVVKMMQKYKVQPNIVTYNCLLEAFANTPSGQVNEARRVLAEMKERGIETDVTTFMGLIKCHAQARDVKGVLSAFHQMQGAPNIQHQTREVYLSLLHALAMAGASSELKGEKYEEALALGVFRGIHKGKLDLRGFATSCVKVPLSYHLREMEETWKEGSLEAPKSGLVLIFGTLKTDPHAHGFSAPEPHPVNHTNFLAVAEARERQREKDEENGEEENVEEVEEPHQQLPPAKTSKEAAIEFFQHYTPPVEYSEKIDNEGCLVLSRPALFKVFLYRTNKKEYLRRFGKDVVMEEGSEEVELDEDEEY